MSWASAFVLAVLFICLTVVYALYLSDKEDR
jgi:hypothetical protein